MTVSLSPVDDASGPGARNLASAVSDSRGDYVIATPPGSYYVTASGKGYFGYEGHNPVSIPPGGTALASIPLVPLPAPPRPIGDDGVIRGTVTLDGKPSQGIQVAAYADAVGGLRGPGIAVSAPTADDGGFTLPVGPGRYFLIARGRVSGSGFGPLSPGDRFGYYPYNPVTVQDGAGLSVILPLVSIPAKASAQNAQAPIILSGMILDQGGSPVAGYRACLFDNAGLLNRPLAFSAPTTADGRFRLAAPRPGTFYLGARSRLGAPPAPGEMVGWLKDRESLTVGWGDDLGGLTVVLGEPLP